MTRAGGATVVRADGRTVATVSVGNVGAIHDQLLRSDNRRDGNDHAQDRADHDQVERILLPVAQDQVPLLAGNVCDHRSDEASEEDSEHDHLDQDPFGR